MNDIEIFGDTFTPPTPEMEFVETLLADVDVYAELKETEVFDHHLQKTIEALGWQPEYVTDGKTPVCRHRQPPQKPPAVATGFASSSP